MPLGEREIYSQKLFLLTRAVMQTMRTSTSKNFGGRDYSKRKTLIDLNRYKLSRVKRFSSQERYTKTGGAD